MKVTRETMVHGGEQQDHHTMMEADLRRRFWVALALTVPVLLLSPTIQHWFGIAIPRFVGYRYLLFGLATLIVGYGGWPFYRGAARALRRGTADMDVLVSVALLAGYAFSAWTTFGLQAMDFYWDISTLVVVLLLGHWMEMRAVRSTAGALRELTKLIPPMANRLHDGQVETVPTSEVHAGDRLLVRPGEKVPIDGAVVEGQSSVNEAMITGESKPAPKKPGDEVIGGSLNGEGALQIEVRKTGAETALAQIVQLVQAAQSSKPPIQKLADRAAEWLTLIALLLAAGAFAYWYGLRGTPLVFALTLAVTVLVIACPHALGLAIPVVTTISTSLGARNGMLIRNADATAQARLLDVVIFDKTGTLTEGQFGLTDIVRLGEWSEEELLRRAAAVEANSEHAIAQGIVRGAHERHLTIPPATGFVAEPGRGARATVEGVAVEVGKALLMEQQGIPVGGAAAPIEALRRQGKTVVSVSGDGTLQGALAQADIVRPESREAVRSLRELGVEVAMLTGDSREVAASVAAELSLDTYFAEVLPENKVDKVRELQQQGKRVAMVGDGINDAPALVQADVGIAIGAGTAVAIEAADVILVRNDPRDVVALMRLSRATMRKMRQNLVWATGYNVVALPLAAGVLAGWGVVLQPEWGALIMGASTIIVVINAMLLRRLRLRPPAAVPAAPAPAGGHVRARAPGH
jgi:P-type Cu2+ transporter